MKIHPLQRSDACSVEGDMGLQIRGTGADAVILIPGDVASALDRLDVSTAEDFAVVLNTFPSAVASELGWDIGTVVRARAGVAEKLRGIVDDDLLDASTVSRAYGAFSP